MQRERDGQPRLVEPERGRDDRAAEHPDGIGGERDLDLARVGSPLRRFATASAAPSSTPASASASNVQAI